MDRPAMPTAAMSSKRMVNVVIITQKQEQFVLKFSLQQLWEREHEMQAAAEQYCIDPMSWNGSRIHRLHAEQDTTEFVLYPEEGCATQSYSQCLKWTPWLTELMQRYYTTGKLCIPTNSRGYDILLALEYFGILYQPQQLEFASYSTYSRVKLWSDYFTHRAVIGDWVADCILEKGSGIIMFATTLAPHKSLVLGYDKLIPLVPVKHNPDENSSQSSNIEADTVFDFFNVAIVEGDQATVDQAAAAAMMRRDFAGYIQNIVTDVQVTFTVEPVREDDDLEERAVLRVEVVDPNAPLDPEPSMSGVDDNIMQRNQSGVATATSGGTPRRVETQAQDPPEQLRSMRSATIAKPMNVIRTATSPSIASALTLPPGLHPRVRDLDVPSTTVEEKESSFESTPEDSWIDELRKTGKSIETLLQQATEQVSKVADHVPESEKKRMQESLEWFSGLGLCEYPSAIYSEVKESGCTPVFEEIPPPSKTGNGSVSKTHSLDGNDESREGSAFIRPPVGKNTASAEPHEQSIEHEERTAPTDEDGCSSPGLIVKDPSGTLERPASVASETENNSTELVSPVATGPQNQNSTMSFAKKPKKKKGGLLKLFRRRGKKVEI